MTAGHLQGWLLLGLAATVARATEWFGANRTMVLGGAGAIVALIVLMSAWSWWSGRAAAEADTLLSAAMQTAESPIVPAPTVPGAQQQAGTFPTEQARTEAALAAFQRVVDEYPDTTAGVAAQYHHAAALMAVGRYDEARQGFEAAAGAADIELFRATAQLGQAEAYIAAGQFDQGLPLLETLAANRDGLLPIDGVLMQLARGYQKAGRAAEARTAFRRIVDEFPDSLYVTEAQTELTKLG